MLFRKEILDLILFGLDRKLVDIGLSLCLSLLTLSAEFHSAHSPKALNVINHIRRVIVRPATENA
jgi:hypothetical protein